MPQAQAGLGEVRHSPCHGANAPSPRKQATTSAQGCTRYLGWGGQEDQDMAPGYCGTAMLAQGSVDGCSHAPPKTLQGIHVQLNLHLAQALTGSGQQQGPGTREGEGAGGAPG